MHHTHTPLQAAAHFLADPPVSVGGKPEALAGVVALYSLDKPHVGVLDQVRHGNAMMAVAAGDMYRQPQIALNQAVTAGQGKVRQSAWPGSSPGLALAFPGPL